MRQGRLAHGYQIRIERNESLKQDDDFLTEYGQLWGIGDDLPADWNEFQQENVGNPAIHSAQIYRSSETRKWMDKRNIRDEFVNR